MDANSAKPQSYELIKKLISYDTTSRDSNLDLIDFVRDYLAELGVESTLIHNETGKKANLYATLGPKDKPGFMLSGHTDVVPVDGQPWDTDPFHVSDINGKLYGRGTADMKSFLAIVLALAPEFLKRGPQVPIHLAFSGTVAKKSGSISEWPFSSVACNVCSIQVAISKDRPSFRGMKSDPNRASRPRHNFLQQCPRRRCGPDCRHTGQSMTGLDAGLL